MANPQTELSLRQLAEWVAAHPNCKRDEIYVGLGLLNQSSPSTLYRRLDLAIERGLLTRSGNTSGSIYTATDKLRIELLRKHLATDHTKRPRVGYNTEWIDDYEPNQTFYLRQSDRARLTARCAPGTAPLQKINTHDLAMFMCDLSFGSSRLEGNDYDYASTIQLAEHHIEKHGGSQRDKVMILNHRDATRHIIDSAMAKDPRFGVNQHFIREIHAALSQDLLENPLMCGRLRTSHVEVYQSSYIPQDIPDQIAGNFNKIIEKAALITDPYEQAFFLLVHIPYLQPFEDCNKRTSRVICNIPLILGGVTPISWMDVSSRPREYSDAIIAVYEHNDPIMLSDVFIECFMRSTERFSLLHRQKNPDPIASRYRQELKSCIRTRVLEGVEAVPSSVLLDDVSDFITYVNAELELLKQNEMLGVRYGLTPGMLTSWCEENAKANTPLQASAEVPEDREFDEGEDTDIDGGRERMRA